MHIPRIEVRSLDETVEAVDLGQTPADVVFLSFSDSDLNALARAYDGQPAPKPTLRLASLAALRHPYSIDLYLERVCARAKLVVARVLGGADYWRYGVDELAALARKGGLKLALLPGDRRADARLEAASTLPRGAVEQIWRYFDEGGPANMASCLGFLSRELGLAASAPPPEPLSAFGRFESACFAAAPGAPRALIVFYRSIVLANDLEPIEALAVALARQGLRHNGRLCHEPQGRSRARSVPGADRPRALRRRAQCDGLFRPARRERGNHSRFHRRAGAAGRAGGNGVRGLAGLAPRPRTCGPCHACRPA